MRHLTTKAWQLVAARPWISIAVIVIVVGGTVAGVVLTGSSAKASAQAGVTTRLESVSTGSVSESVSTTGDLTPADEKDVSFGSAAEITSVRVAVGDKIAKGAVLGTIQRVTLKSDLAQARAALATDEATRAGAEASDSTTSADLAADKASVSDAKSSVADAKTALAGSTLRSPIAGTVATVNVSKGDESSGSGSSSSSTSSSTSTGSSAGSQATGGSSTGTSTTSSSSSSGDFVILGLRKWTISATVDDTQVGLIAKGDQAQITTDNVTGTIFGTVSSVSVLSSTTSGSASYPVTIAVTGNPSGLHDGASATISLIYKQVSNVLTVPTTAIHTSGTSKYVELASDGKQVKTTVTTGLASGGTTQIKSGLKSGDQVYVETVTAGRTTTGGTSGTTTRGGTGEFPGAATGGFPGGGTGGGFAGGTGFAGNSGGGN